MLPLALTLLSLLGCPEDPTTATAPTDGPGALPPQPQAGSANPGDPNATPPAGGDAAQAGQPGSTTPGAPPAGGPGGPGAPASDLSSIITGDKVKVTLTLKGAEKAQISVMTPGATAKDMPTLLAIIQATSGTVTVDAPATFDKPLYFAALADLTGDGPSADDLSGVTEPPVTLAGKDVAATVTLTTDNSWTKRMPWQAPPDAAGGAPGGAVTPGGPGGTGGPPEAQGAPNAGGSGPPAAGASPSTPPGSGAPPSGPPPAGGAPATAPK